MDFDNSLRKNHLPVSIVVNQIHPDSYQINNNENSIHMNNNITKSININNSRNNNNSINNNYNRLLRVL